MEPLHQKVTDALNTLLPSGAPRLVSRWNGRIEELVGQDDAAVIRRDGTIEVAARRLNDPDRWRTYLHELVHAHSPLSGQTDMEENLGWEEGVVEHLQRIIRPTVLQGRMDVDEAAIRATEPVWPYRPYIAAFDKLQRDLGVTDADAGRWYAQLLQKPVEGRRQFLAISVLRSPGRLKLMEAIGSANTVLRKNLRR